jgi:hypothetical protein
MQITRNVMEVKESLQELAVEEICEIARKK